MLELLVLGLELGSGIRSLFTTLGGSAYSALGGDEGAAPSLFSVSLTLSRAFEADLSNLPFQVVVFGLPLS